MNDLLKCDFVDPLRNVKKSSKIFGRDCLWQIKEHLELCKEQVHPKVAPISEESLQWDLKLLKRKMNMDTSHMTEFQRLLHKASSEGLTYDEKVRFYRVKREQQIPDEPRCTCHSKGEGCKLHMVWGMNLTELGS